MNWKTIDKARLEAEIDQRSATLKEMRRGRTRTGVEDALAINRVLAEHNALVAVFNSLQ